MKIIVDREKPVEPPITEVTIVLKAHEAYQLRTALLNLDVSRVQSSILNEFTEQLKAAIK